ncbi:hypothetical protein chiPu_0003394 [Chiloscyllium punctatum]|uniref:Uncharacterized protein n=1 Tax=Chiloscyllium punctatum TaxID=137246 RepID=A0A401S3N6_CHIPU|nr:hypothetical protein [Chiloscyllium punctatum]
MLACSRFHREREREGGGEMRCRSLSSKKPGRGSATPQWKIPAALPRSGRPQSSLSARRVHADEHAAARDFSPPSPPRPRLLSARVCGNSAQLATERRLYLRQCGKE